MGVIKQPQSYNKHLEIMKFVRNFSVKAIDIINYVKLFQNFSDSTSTWFQI